MLVLGRKSHIRGILGSGLRLLVSRERVLLTNKVRASVTKFVENILLLEFLKCIF